MYAQQYKLCRSQQCYRRHGCLGQQFGHAAPANRTRPAKQQNPASPKCTPAQINRRNAHALQYKRKSNTQRLMRRNTAVRQNCGLPSIAAGCSRRPARMRGSRAGIARIRPRAPRGNRPAAPQSPRPARSILTKHATHAQLGQTLTAAGETCS